MMLFTVIVSAIGCLAVILSVLFKPAVTVKGKDINIYWIPAFLSAIVLMIGKAADIQSVFRAFTEDSAVNPLKILVLFISMTLLSVYLDEVGFFRYVATFALKHSGKNKIAMFTVLYFTVAILTVVTSNDIVILTFSPFICYFSKNAKINPVPYLVAEFVSANTWSMMLIIGNPTNIYLATAAGIKFTGYTAVMAIPTLIAGSVAYGILLLLFYRKLSSPEQTDIVVIHVEDKVGLCIGLIHLIGCTSLLVVASYIKWEMWYICLAFAVSLFLCIFIHRIIHKEIPKELLRCLKRTSWELIPFVLSMFIIVIAFNENGITEKIGAVLTRGETIITYGVSSFLTANIINNIPMSVLFGEVTKTAGEHFGESVFASVIGSNIGAFLTPVGALAGIMWSGILKTHEVKFGFLQFIKYGFAVAVPTLLAALGGLYLSLSFME